MKNIEIPQDLLYNELEVENMSSELKVNFNGLLNELKLPVSKCLWPLFEAVVNSIQSISDSTQKDCGKITIEAIRTQESIKEVVKNVPYTDFIITDNGVGFTEDNYNSFLEAYSSYKVSKGCKGLGRFLWLKAFDRVEIESVYEENNKYYKRNFEFSKEHFIEPEDNAKEIAKEKIYTKIQLIGFHSNYQQKCSVTLEPIAKKIIEHCMMYFISNTCPKIIITDNIETINVNDYFDTKIKDTLNQDEFEINEEQFHIYHIRMEENVSKHELHLCASDREVESLDLSKKIPNLNTKLVDSNGNSYFYIGYITGNYLDENVNSNRTSFNIMEEHNGINKVTRNDLFETAREYIELYLQDDIKTIVDKKKERVNSYIETKKPQYKFLINAKPEVLDEIPNGLDDEAIELELHKQSQKWERELNELGIKIAKEVKSKINSIDDYDKIFDNYCSGISELSKASLTEYVLRRKTILDLFDKALQLDDEDKYKKEEIIHTLICPMRHSSNEIPFDEMNLWLIDEKLAYHHYLASDLATKKLPYVNSNSDDRIDIAIFDQAFSYSSDERNFGSISIVELKRPGRDNYSANGKDKDPIEQVLKYVKEIKEGTKKLANGRDFGDVQNTPFYCYIIADLTKSLRERAENMNFTQTPDHKGYYGYNANRNAYVEIISYDKLLDDAKKSNKVLFDKLFNPKANEIKNLYPTNKEK